MSDIGMLIEEASEHRPTCGEPTHPDECDGAYCADLMCAAEDCYEDVPCLTARLAAEVTRLAEVIDALAALHPTAVHPGNCRNHGLAVARVLVNAGFSLTTTPQETAL